MSGRAHISHSYPNSIQTYKSLVAGRWLGGAVKLGRPSLRMTAFLGRLLKFLLRPILHLDHRTVRLSSGVLEIEDVRIHPAAANAALAVFGLRLVDGRLERMRVAMPWRQDARVELAGLVLVLQPCARTAAPAPRQRPTEERRASPAQPLGLEALIALVSRLLSRMQISVRGVTVRLLDAHHNPEPAELGELAARSGLGSGLGLRPGLGSR